MRAVIVSKGSKEEVEKKLEENNIEYNSEKPDVVVSYGGDGTLLIAEREYPGVPKLVIRGDSKICNKCLEDYKEHPLKKVKRGEYEVEGYTKLRGVIKREGRTVRKMLALNEIGLRNRKPLQALRLKVEVDDRFEDIIIGDGAVVATPFGSTAYYNSITRECFEKGVRIGFNNSREEREPVEVEEKVVLKIMRTKAYVTEDNNPEMFKAEKGDVIIVKKSDEKANIIEI